MPCGRTGFARGRRPPPLRPHLRSEPPVPQFGYGSWKSRGILRICHHRLLAGTPNAASGALNRLGMDLPRAVPFTSPLKVSTIIESVFTRAISPQPKPIRIPARPHPPPRLPWNLLIISSPNRTCTSMSCRQSKIRLRRRLSDCGARGAAYGSKFTAKRDVKCATVVASIAGSRTKFGSFLGHYVRRAS